MPFTRDAKSSIISRGNIVPDGEFGLTKNVNFALVLANSVGLLAPLAAVARPASFEGSLIPLAAAAKPPIPAVGSVGGFPFPLFFTTLSLSNIFQTFWIY